MKLSLERNNLIEQKSDPENYIFFAVRNAKAEQIVFYIKNYFAKKQLFVEVDIDYKCIKIDLFKEKEKENFLVRSYVWLKDIEKETSFNNSFSNFMFDVKSFAITSHLGRRTPNIIQTFWDNMQKLADSGYFEHHIFETNYPFSNLKAYGYINIKTALIKKPDDFISVALDSGYEIGRLTTLYEIELYFAERGFEVKGKLKNNKYSFTLLNTKKGNWEFADFDIEFSEHTETSAWHPDIYFGSSHVKNIFLNEPNGNVTKYYLDFKKVIQSDDFYNMMEYSLKRKYYPFRERGYLSC